MVNALHCRLATLAWVTLSSFALALVLVSAGVAAAGTKIRLVPKFFAGESLRYRIQTRTATQGTTTTPITNPEGASQQNLATRLVVRLDVLGAPPAAVGATTGSDGDGGGTRVRASYEQAEASAESDAVNPGAASPSVQYKSMEGRAIEFTIRPGGVLTDFQGLDEIFPNRADAEPMLSWARGLTSSAGFPKRGIEVGQKWKSERELEGMPLTGLLWRTESTYLRDEACNSLGSGGANPASPGAPAPRTAVGAPQEMCAVILTRFEIERHASARADATPDDYRKSGLRTSGKWTGSGESMDSLSIATGILVSSTQTSEQHVDYQIVSTNTGSAIHRMGQVTTKTEITLLPAPASAPQS